MDSTARFSDRVAQYLRYRPGYPNEVASLLLAQFSLAKPVVADIGAGTGFLSIPFLKNECLVHAVEPNDPMRRAGDTLLKKYSAYTSVSGTAESTTLPDSSVDLIIAGQAFHWFDPVKFRQECLRIGRGKVPVALIWNKRQQHASPFMNAYASLLDQHSKDVNRVNHQLLKEEVFEDFFLHGFKLETLQNEQRLDLPSLLGRVESSSYMPAVHEKGNKEMRKSVEEMFCQFENEGKVSLLYSVEIYAGSLKT